MKEDKPKLDIKTLKYKAAGLLKRAYRYALVGFIVFIALVYGYIYYRLTTLNNAQPSPDAVTSQVSGSQAPVIDKAAVSQLESLQNNSVSVQSLFNQERTNPF